jgi:hypothetical protein
MRPVEKSTSPSVVLVARRAVIVARTRTGGLRSSVNTTSFFGHIHSCFGNVAVDLFDEIGFEPVGRRQILVEVRRQLDFAIVDAAEVTEQHDAVAGELMQIKGMAAACP